MLSWLLSPKNIVRGDEKPFDLMASTEYICLELERAPTSGSAFVLHIIGPDRCCDTLPAKVAPRCVAWDESEWSVGNHLDVNRRNRGRKVGRHAHKMPTFVSVEPVVVLVQLAHAEYGTG